MTNFQKDYKKKKLLTPEIAVLLIPVSIGSFLSLLLFFLVIFPSYKNLRKNINELNTMEMKRDQLPKIEKDLDAAVLKLKDTKSQQSRILDLIGGSKSIETYLAKFDLIANDAGVEITLIKPLATELPKRVVTTNIQNPQKILNIDPLLASNLQKRSLEIKISGSYRSLMVFLKGIESLRTVTIAPEIEMKITKNNISNKINSNTISMTLSTYGYQN